MVPIFVVLTILLFVVIDLLRQYRRMPAIENGIRSVAQTAPMPAHLPLRPGRFHHPGHTWVDIQQDGTVRSGFDAFIGLAIGEIDRLTLLPVGTRIHQGEPMLLLESGGRELQIPAPVSGLIRKSNEHVDPGRSSETSSQNWVYELAPFALGSEIQSLKIAEKATAWMTRELDRFSGWISNMGQYRQAPALPDGGTPVVGALSHLDDGIWQEFQTRFLQSTHQS